jgi:drug/metabolite transporter (DMT)-like permease
VNDAATVRPAATHPAARGLLAGGIGVLVFSWTLPATRLAVPELGGTFVGLGRALVAAALAAAYLAWSRPPMPPRDAWASLALVAAGVVVGFPLLSALAMGHVPASHGAVLTGALPLATAAAAVLRAGERPGLRFWLAAVGGFAAVVTFALLEGGGRAGPGDLLLLGAVAAAGLGYAEGGRLARTMGGGPVVAWALVLSAPFLAVPVWLAARDLPPAPSAGAWLAFGYVSAFSMFLGFFAWYRGLALGGVARVGQLQLAQPVLTLLWSALLLGEPLRPSFFLFAAAVSACVLAGVRARVRPASSR